jgi:hypothetical protein
VRQEIILLRLIEVVNFVDEENGALPATLQIFRLLDDLFEVLDTGANG